MKFSEMKTLTSRQLLDFVDNCKEDLFKKRVVMSLHKKCEHPHKFKILRKQIARAHTLIRQNQG